MSEDVKDRPACRYEDTSCSNTDCNPMSLWTKAQQLQGDALQQVRAVYGEHFPIEVRHFLAAWIEEKMWDLDPENPQHEQYVTGLVASLIQELEAKANTMTTEDLFLTKLKLIEAANMFRQRYSHNPLSLFRIIRHCLNTEMKLVQQVENVALGRGGIVAPGLSLIPDSNAEIAQQLEFLRRRTQETGEDLRKMEQEQEAFALQYHECTKLNAHLQHLQTQPQNQQNVELEKKLRRQKEMLEQMLNQKVAGLVQLRLTLADKLKDTITNLNTLQSRVLDDELIRWKREQQLQGNGAQFNNNLDNIQEWCESLAEIIWHNRQQIKEAERLKQKIGLEPPGVADILPNLNNQITQLLSSLVTSTFIIEKQPPQVMKTNTRFTSTVRLLVGGKLNVHMTPPQVKVTIISEAQANALLKNDKMAKGEASGEILNNTGTMEYHQATRQLSVSFRNMQLKKIKRAEKKGTESVMDEKFSLLFQSQFSVGGGELVFQVWTLSLPVVVIVHGNQEPHAWATVTWDNAFAEPGRIPFAVPDKVAWLQVAEALNTKFKAATGRLLTDENLRFLAEKAFRGGGQQQVGDYSTMMLSWSQFCKEPLPERNFTFWEWFYAVMKLTREHLRGPWIDGGILGFVRKKQAEEMLSTCASGTFLLRFSDSELGGVTIAWVGDQTEVFMLQPFTSKDFAIRSLADRISDLQHLLYLFPEIPKEQAFGKYYTPFTENQPTTNNGYVKPLLVTHVPGWGGPAIGGGSYPPTPQNMYQPQSPDPSVTRDTPSVASAVSDSVSRLIRMMYNPTYFPRQRWHVPKEQERNFVAAFFHMATIALTCTSLAQLGWFRLRGGQCAPHLAVYQFFSFGYFDSGVRQTDVQFRSREVVSSPVPIQYHSPSGTLQCVTPETANLMRVIIILCFMAMISSLVGFFLDIVGPTKKFLKVIQRNSIPSIFTVLWVVAIIGVCYDITKLLEVLGIQVSYEYGCYTITAAGAVAVCATACNLLQHHSPIEDVQRRRLIDDWDGIETFSVVGGGLRGVDTPLESIPLPPPYSP